MKKGLIYLVGIYQKIPSQCHSKCRFLPTCSNYMIESLEIHGLFKGSYLGIKRIIRCNPWGESGIDLVPRKKDKNEKL